MPIFRTLIAAGFFVASPLLLAAPVNINTASQAELAASLSGVGPKLAQRIVSYRLVNGEFQTPGSLIYVKGVGPKILKKNEGDILVKDPKADQ